MPEDYGLNICKICNTYDSDGKGAHISCMDSVNEAVRLAVQKERGVWLAVIGETISDKRLAHYVISKAIVKSLELPSGT